MRLYSAIQVVLFSHAIAQSAGTFMGIISSGTELSSFADADLTSAASSRSLALTSRRSGTRSSPLTSRSTVPRASAATVIFATSSISTTILAASNRPFDTSRLTTDLINVSLFTVASTATPTASRSASASDDTSSDRVAVIALATILGALVLGLAILIFYLLQRRKLQHSRQTGTSRNEHASTQPSTSMRHRPASWLGSLRRSRRSRPNETTPRQQYAAATQQPLMSEGSPLYGFHSPPQARPLPLFSGTSRSQHNQQATVRAVPLANDPEAGRRDQLQHASPSLPIMGNIESPVQQHLKPQHKASDHDIGNPYVDVNPKTPELLQSRYEATKVKTGTPQESSAQLQYAPLGSHPPNQSAKAELPATLEVPSEADDQKTERSSSIPRAGFANAIAGLGLDRGDPINKEIATQSMVAEPSTSVPEGTGSEISALRPEEAQTQNPSKEKTIAERDLLKPFKPHLSIPKMLMAGRQKSKKTRFSIAGNEEVSPTSESWLDNDDGERGHYRRPSTISPISPERHERRAFSENLTHRPSQRRGGSVSSTGNPISAPAALSSQALQNVALQPQGEAPSVTAPGGQQIQQKVESQNDRQLSKLQRASAPVETIKRKPAPLDLATLIRKPLPPHPIPTSKYNPTARQVTKPKPAHTSPQESRQAPRDENADRASSRLRGGPVSQVPRPVVPTAFDNMVEGMSGMHDNRSNPQDNLRSITAESPAWQPETGVVDNNVIISSYMQPASREPSQHTNDPRGLQQHNPAHPNNLDRRDTVQFFEDPGNREYAQVYGSYYSQSSPVQFNSPTSPGGNLVYPSIQPTVQQYQYQPQPQSQLQSPPQYNYQPQSQYQERSRHLQPPPPQQPQFQAQPRSYPGYRQEPAGYIKPVYQQAAAASSHTNQTKHPNLSSAPTRSGPPPPSISPYPWRDSQQDAWRDSLSRSGSDPTSTNASGNGATSGTGIATSNASSGGGGGPGLWGSPGFFGVER